MSSESGREERLKKKGNGHGNGNGEDRRRSPRFPARHACRVEDVQCEIEDVSYAGLRFRSQKPLPADTLQNLTIPIQDAGGRPRDLHVQANIRWCRELITGEYEVGAEVSVLKREDEVDFLSFLFHGSTRAYLEKREAVVELEGYRSLVELAADPILVVQEGRIAFSNQAAVEMFGYTSGEMGGMEFDRLVVSGPHAPAAPPPSFRRIEDESRPDYYTLRKANGETVDVEIRSRSILYRHKRARLSILRDLGERKAFERMLVQVERLKVLGELSAGIAHDVNNCLTSILAAAELIEMGLPEEKREEALRAIKTSAIDGGAVLRRIQGFGRLDDARAFRVFDVNAVVADARLLTRPKWEQEAEARGAEIRVVESLHEGEALIRGNLNDVRQALINLIINAVDAMPEGGELGLVTEVAKDAVLLTVRDTGTGISEKIRERVFDPFFSTKGERGSGLGLSTVYGIMIKHGGSIDVSSEKGEGTVFTLRFPRAERTGDAAEARPDAESSSFRTPRG